MDLRELDARCFERFRGHHRGDRRQYIVASTRRATVGYALLLQPLEGDCVWHLDAVAVVPARQGEGIGTQLFRECAGWLVDAGAEALTTVALVGEDKPRRERWFARLGGLPNERGAFVFSLRQLEVLANRTGEGDA
jgi:GNAT superfamily N-acetyltransferase